MFMETHFPLFLNIYLQFHIIIHFSVSVCMDYRHTRESDLQVLGLCNTFRTINKIYFFLWPQQILDDDSSDLYILETNDFLVCKIE